MIDDVTVEMTAEQTIQRLIDASVKAVDALAFSEIRGIRNKDAIVKELLDAIADGHECKDRMKYANGNA